jgi:Domain of unknown function (DUF4276)
MKTLIFFVEERSMMIVLDSLKSRFAPQRHVIISPHEGKNDLEKSFPRKIRAWNFPADALFVVMRDNDGSDCAILKERLISSVPLERRDRTRVRVVMQQLESWYLGDPMALVEAEYLTAAKAEIIKNTAKYRDPERIENADEVFQKLAGAPGKLAAARRLGPFLDPDRNRSTSLRVVVETLTSFDG